MKKVPVTIALAILFVILYYTAPFIDVSDKVILSMFIASPFVILFMAYIILKYGKPSAFTFDDRYYDDLEEN